MTAVGMAQEQPPVPPSGDSTADQGQQTPPPASPATVQPPQTPQTPPATTPTTPSDQPLQPATPGQPRTGIRQPPPPLPKIPDIRQPGETGWWIGVSGWFPTETPTIDKGRGATFTQPSFAKFQGKPKVSEGVEAGIAVGLHNALRFSYFESRASGTFTNTNDLVLWGQLYTAGNLVSTDYRVQNFKLSFEYLTFPYPVESRKFRLKTLYQLQYTTVRTGFDLPLLPLVDSTGAPLVDASGNPLSYAADGTRSIILPTFGLGVAKYVTRNFRLEADATGFAIPHHSTIWDADASANFRIGHFEVRAGAKAYHYKSTTQQDFYVRGTMASAFVGLRWYSD